MIVDEFLSDGNQGQKAFTGVLPILRTLRATRALRAMRAVSFVRGLQVTKSFNFICYLRREILFLQRLSYFNSLRKKDEFYRKREKCDLVYMMNLLKYEFKRTF